MNTKIKFSILIIVVAGLMSVSSALAQTADPIINSAAFNAAQISQGACQTFKDNLWNISANKFKAMWYPSISNPQQNCYVVLGTWNDAPISAGGDEPTLRSQSVINFELQIKNSTDPITKDEFAAAEVAIEKQKAEPGLFSKFVGQAITNFFVLFNTQFAGLAALAGIVYAKAAENIFSINYNSITFVNVGWSIVRNFANMFFILALIVIGIGTILRIEKYNYQKLLVRLILMALLVNFSKVIAVTIINVVNVLSVTLYGNGMKDVLSLIYNIWQPEKIGISLVGGGWMAALSDGIGKFFFMVVAAITFLAIAALFVVRLVGLYVLIIFSPIAYAAGILPNTQQWSKQWWDTFIKYLVWVPVTLFMLRLTMLIAQPGMGGINSGGDSIFTFFVLTAFMWGSLILSRKAGMLGAASVHSAADKALGTAKKAGLWSLGAGGRSLARGTPITGVGNRLATGKYASRLPLAKTVAPAFQATGAKIGEFTAWPQAKLRQVQQSFALGTRNRNKQIDEMAMENLLNKFGTKMDKDMFSKLNQKQKDKLAQKAVTQGKYEDVAKFMELGGKQMGDAFMRAIKDADPAKPTPNSELMKEEIYRTVLTDRGVKDADFAANKDKYMNLKLESVTVGFGDKAKVIPYIFVPNKNTVDALTAAELAALTPEELREKDKKLRKKGRRDDDITPPPPGRGTGTSRPIGFAP